MKRKSLKLEQYRINMKLEEKLSFGTKSPFPEISFPPEKTLFSAWHGNLIACDVRGTIYVCRLDNDPKPLNFDIYSIRSTENEKPLEIRGPQRSEYHWVGRFEDIPTFLKDSMPRWVKEKIKKYLTINPLKPSN